MKQLIQLKKTQAYKMQDRKFYFKTKLQDRRISYQNPVYSLFYNESM